jgi:hypothetical protein
MLEYLPAIILIPVLFWLLQSLLLDYLIGKNFPMISSHYLESHPTASSWDKVTCIHCDSSKPFKKNKGSCTDGFSCSDCGEHLYRSPNEKARKFTWTQNR